MIYENGNLLAETERFSDDDQRVCADIDLDRLRQERMRLTSFGDSVLAHRERLRSFRHIRFGLGLSRSEVPFAGRSVDFPMCRAIPQNAINGALKSTTFRWPGSSSAFAAPGLGRL